VWLFLYKLKKSEIYQLYNSPNMGSAQAIKELKRFDLSP